MFNITNIYTSTVSNPCTNPNRKSKISLQVFPTRHSVLQATSQRSAIETASPYEETPILRLINQRHEGNAGSIRSQASSEGRTRGVGGVPHCGDNQLEAGSQHSLARAEPLMGRPKKERPLCICGRPRARSASRHLLKSCGCGNCIRKLAGQRPGAHSANAGVSRGS